MQPLARWRTNGSLYRVAKPIVNVSRAPNDWQTFDIIQHAPTCSNGALTSPGDITLVHNGVLVLDAPSRASATISVSPA